MLGYKTIDDFTLEECEMYLKRDNISQEERMQVEQRRGCLQMLLGESIGDSDNVVLQSKKEPDSRPETIMEKFPEYGFTPVSLLEFKYESLRDIVFFLSIIAGLLACIIAGLSIAKANGDLIGASVVGFALMLVFDVPCAAAYFKDKKRHAFYQRVADYVSTKEHGIYYGRFVFVKDRKFGVLDSNKLEISVTANYDQLIWQMPHLLKAEMDGKVMLVDINNHKCTDKYDKLIWVEKGKTLEAEDGGRRFLIDIYGNELS